MNALESAYELNSKLQNKPCSLNLDSNERQGQIAPWLKQAFSQFDPACLQRYPDDSGLVQKIAALFSLETTETAVFNGGDEAITCWLNTIEKNSRVLLPVPTFSVYSALIPMRDDLDLVTIEPNQKCQQSVDQLVESLTSEGSNLEKKIDSQSQWLVLVNPNNPTGQYLSSLDIEAIVQTAKDNQCNVLLDEAYIEFAETDFSEGFTRTKDWINRFDNLVILRTFSKAFGLAGLRCGYLLGDASLIQNIRSKRMPYSVNQLAVAMASAAIEQLDVIEQECKQVAAKRDDLVIALKVLGLNVLPSAANFIAVKCNTRKAQLLKSVTQKSGIRLRYFETANGDEIARITIPDQIEAVKDCLALCSQPELICLDMDGVLIDVNQSYDQAVAQTVQLFSDQNISMDRITAKRNQSQCNDDWKLTQMLLADLGVDVSLEQVTEQFQALYLGEASAGLIRLETPYISQTSLQKMATKAELAIVTSRPRNEALLGRTLCQMEDVSMVAREDATPKPSGDGIMLVAQQKNAQRVWMVGDNVADIQAIKNAAQQGLDTVAIGVSPTNKQALYDAGADIVLDDINQIQELL